MTLQEQKPGDQKGFRALLHEIIFEADTPAGKAFDVILLGFIILSVMAVILESVQTFQTQWGEALRVFEWVVTIFFTVEYILRLISVERPLRYAFSFYGVVDLLATAPTYLSLLLSGFHYLLVIRVLRLLRVFRVLKMVRYLGEAQILIHALKASRFKITVFLFTVITLVILIGSLMYLIEGPEHGFINIPVSIYWTIVTLTTVGYGDIVPQTVLGKAVSSAVMIMGYGIIAVPTGIVTAEIAQANRDMVTTQTCRHCSREGHASDAAYCKFCGVQLA